MRYVNLTSLLILRSVSTAVCKRFPTMDHLVEAGETEPLPYWSLAPPSWSFLLVLSSSHLSFDPTHLSLSPSHLSFGPAQLVSAPHTSPQPLPSDLSSSHLFSAPPTWPSAPPSWGIKSRMEFICCVSFLELMWPQGLAHYWPIRTLRAAS